MLSAGALFLTYLLGSACLDGVDAVSGGGADIYMCDPMNPAWGCTKFDPPSPPNTNCVTKVGRGGRANTGAGASKVVVTR